MRRTIILDISNHSLSYFRLFFCSCWNHYLLDFSKDFWNSRWYPNFILCSLSFYMIFLHWWKKTRMHQKLSFVKFCLKVHKIPILYKMPGYVMNTSSLNFDANIMPWHTSLRFFIKVWRLKLSRMINIRNSKVTKISAFPKFFLLFTNLD